MIRRAWQEDRARVLVFAALAVATVLPLWVGRYLPLLDGPNHLSAIAIWHFEHDPRFDFDHSYYLNKAPLPYWVHYYACHLLAYLVPVEVANKIFLTGYALALPLGAAALARRFGRSPWLALFAFPLVWNFNLAEGFISYCAGLAACVWGLCLVDRHCERPSVTSTLAVLGFGSLMYFFHLLPYMFFLVAAGLLVLAQDEPLRIRRLVERGAPVVGSCAIGMWAYVHERSLGFRSISGERNFIFDPLGEVIAHVPGRLLNFLSSGRDEWVVAVLACSWIVLVLAGARGRDVDPRRPFGLYDLRAELCFALAVACVLFLPRSMHRPFNWYMINLRFVPVAALFGALLVRGDFAGRRRWLFAPVAAAGLFYAIDVARMIVVFNRHVDGFDELVAKIPLHRATITLAFQPRSDPEVNVDCFNQWPSYTQIRRGGYNFYNFNYGFPLRYKRSRPAPLWNHPEMFNFETMGRAWDYFLTHNEGVRTSLFPALATEGKVVLVYESGPWKLWQRIGEPAPEPPVTDVPLNAY